MSPLNCCRDETISTLEVMRQQEERGYLCGDYLRQEERAFVQTLTEKDTVTCCENRAKMVQWCYTLIDACGTTRETVAFAMSYFDRFLDTSEGHAALVDSDTFQLAAMASLYTAIKMHEPAAISSHNLSKLSNGFYNSQQLEAMEQRILNAIHWRVNTPTALAFVRLMLSLVPRRALDDEWKAQLYELARIQTEMAVADYQFVTTKASSVAFASMLNAAETLNFDAEAMFHKFVLPEVSIDSNEVRKVQGLLYMAVAGCNAKFVPATRAFDSCGAESNSGAKRRSSYKISPRTVCNPAL